jgi:hypothetical protein
MGKQRILEDNDVYCVMESVPLHPQKKAKSCQLTPATPAELILGDANNGNEVAAVSTQKEIPMVSIELTMCKERLKESLEWQMNILAEQEVKDKNFRSIVNELEAKVKELEDSAKLKEKVYEAKIKKLKEKAKYKQKSMLLTLELQQTQLQLSTARDKMQSYVTMYEEEDPRAAAEVLMKELIVTSVSPSNIAKGFLKALLDRKKCHKSFERFIIDHEVHLSEVEKYFSDKRYLTLKEKFSPWICLRELDFLATVSFRGYEVIRRIEFAELESAKSYSITDSS